MDTDITMAFLVAAVFWDVVKVVTTDHNCPLSFRRDNYSFKDAPTNGNIASKGTLFVNVSAFPSFSRCIETKSSILEPAI